MPSSAGAGSGCRRGPQPPHGDCKNSVRGPPGRAAAAGAAGTLDGRHLGAEPLYATPTPLRPRARARPRRGRGRRPARDEIVAAGEPGDRGDRRDGRCPDDSARDDGAPEATEAEAAQAEATETARPSRTAAAGRCSGATHDARSPVRRSTSGSRSGSRSGRVASRRTWSTRRATATASSTSTRSRATRGRSTPRPAR